MTCLNFHLKTEYTGAEMGCDACNISGRIGTITVTIGGEPYDKETFQTLRDMDDERKDEGSDIISVCSEEKDPSDVDEDESAPPIVHSKLVMGVSPTQGPSDRGRETDMQQARYAKPEHKHIISFFTGVSPHLRIYLPGFLTAHRQSTRCIIASDDTTRTSLEQPAIYLPSLLDLK